MKNPNNFLTKNTTVLFATFSLWLNGKRLPTNGTIEPLRDYLVPRVKKFVLIDQPIPGEELLMPRIEVFTNTNFIPEIKRMSFIHYWMLIFLKIFNTPGTQIIFKVRDLISVIDWGIRDHTKYDVFIGLECINALAGIILKKLGIVKVVVYYVSDYSPNRYPQKWFNNLYLFLDRYCATHADYIWDVSKAMQPARISAGLDKAKSAPVVHVPNGLYPSQIKAGPRSEIMPFSIVYMGTLGEENGPDLIIRIMSRILKKFPKTIFHIIGGGENSLVRLKKLADYLIVRKSIIFYGYIQDSEKMSDIMRKCYLAVAPYRNIPGSVRLYADAGKIRAYLAAGLPVITSDVPPYGREAAQNHAALMVRDNEADFFDAIELLFVDQNIYQKILKNTIKFVQKSTWENTFLNAFNQIK